MATYDIDKITLPNGDVCNLYSTNADENENLFVNGGPEIVADRWGNGYFPIGFSYASGNILDSNSIIMDFYDIKLSFSAAYSGTYAGLSKYIARASASNNFSTQINSVLVEALHEGDYVTYSMEYKGAFNVNFHPSLYLQISSSSSRLEVFDTTDITLNASNNWTKVTCTGTVPSGWEDALSALANGTLYQGACNIILAPSAAGDFHIRKIKLNKGKTATEYTINSYTQSCRVGANSAYFALKDSTLFANNGNKYNITATNRIFPIVGAETPNGFWGQGSCGDLYQFAYSTNSGYTAAAEYGEVYSLPTPNNSATSMNRYSILTTKPSGQVEIPLQNATTGSDAAVLAVKYYDPAGAVAGRIAMTNNTLDGNKYPWRFTIYQYGLNSSTGARLEYYDGYALPTPPMDATASNSYNILTTKNPHDIPIETITVTAGTNVSIVSQSVKRTGNVVAGYTRFTTSASIAPYAYVINSLPASAHGAVFTLFDQYNGQINNSNVCLYMDVSNAGLRVSAGNLAAGTYSAYFNYICS